jgi:predicted RNA binding protein YcfA (HicA-like mRNA interferase family)
MARGTLNQKRARKMLEAQGWTKTVGGKHNVKIEKPGHRPITLPKHSGAGYGKQLAAAIMRQGGLEWE